MRHNNYNYPQPDILNYYLFFHLIIFLPFSLLYSYSTNVDYIITVELFFNLILITLALFSLKKIYRVVYKWYWSSLTEDEYFRYYKITETRLFQIFLAFVIMLFLLCFIYLMHFKSPSMHLLILIAFVVYYIPINSIVFKLSRAYQKNMIDDYESNLKFSSFNYTPEERLELPAKQREILLRHQKQALES